MDLFGSSIDSPDLGFLALIDFLSRIQKEPKPLISTLSLLFIDSIIIFGLDQLKGLYLFRCNHLGF
ncbi:MAG: hypothetical protein CM15mP13_0760 [Pseudomonadota bacterium]|nr:MAG: hypothetical protein CM15mP13_0760 [Pseudomonadota bacterium]